MNAPAALRATARRAGRFNLWALIVIIALGGVFVVKASTVDRHVPSRHFEARETPLDWSRSKAIEKP